MISVLIPTLNERHNIADCIGTVAGWAAEVVVIDSHSVDGTREIAGGLGAKLVDFRWQGQGPKKKNWALANVHWKSEWVLILDADERIPVELAHEIQQTVRTPRADGYLISRRFMFMGKWLRHCGYSPSWNLRLFRHQKGRYETLAVGDTRSGDNEVHEHVRLDGTLGRLRGEMLHFAYPDVFTWMDKHNRYSNWEAVMEVQASLPNTAAIGQELSQKRRLKRWSRQLPFRPMLRFVYAYFIRGGLLDGYEGLAFCRLLATYELLSQLKARELRRKPPDVVAIQSSGNRNGSK